MSTRDPSAPEDPAPTRGDADGGGRGSLAAIAGEVVPAAEPHEPQDLVAEVASDVRRAIAPVRTAVRSDVGRFAAFLRGIQSGYLIFGLLLLLGAGIAGVLVTLLGGFSDWYMHLAMYVVLMAFVLLYVRAHQRRYRIVGAIWALLGLVLIGYFAWILIDLVPPRLDVLSGRPRPEGFTGPAVVLRPEASLLWLPIAMLIAVGTWLFLHWVYVGRFRERAHDRRDGSRLP
ncbi:MAG: hypothetical protein JNJ59_06655 [Deltaproteobacteria bacterium]|jgi:hypothetical protein|nr:hypothetical protein [Deltaproteobacteria bacterium]